MIVVESLPGKFPVGYKKTSWKFPGTVYDLLEWGYWEFSQSYIKFTITNI